MWFRRTCQLVCQVHLLCRGRTATGKALKYSAKQKRKVHHTQCSKHTRKRKAVQVISCHGAPENPSRCSSATQCSKTPSLIAEKSQCCYDKRNLQQANTQQTLESKRYRNWRSVQKLLIQQTATDVLCWRFSWLVPRRPKIKKSIYSLNHYIKFSILPLWWMAAVCDKAAAEQHWTPILIEESFTPWLSAVVYQTFPTETSTFTRSHWTCGNKCM